MIAKTNVCGERRDLSFGRFLSSGQSLPGSHLRAASVGLDDHLAAELPQMFLLLLNRILLEKASDHDGIEIRSNLNNRAIHKAAYPTVPAVEPPAILRRS